MGIPDSSLQDLLEKVRSWISWGTVDLSAVTGEFAMSDKGTKRCCGCELDFTHSIRKYLCGSCGRNLCANCVWGYGSLSVGSDDAERTVDAGVDIKSCKFCSNISIRNEGGRRFCEKVYPSDSPRRSPEPSSPCSSSERLDGYSPHTVIRSSIDSLAGHPSRISVRYSPNRSDEEETGDSARTFFSPSSEYCNDTSDVDSSSVSARHEFYSFKSVGSSPSDSPSRIHISSKRVGHSVQKEIGGTRYQNNGPFDNTVAVLGRPESRTEDSENADDCADGLSIYRDQCQKSQKPLDFENNGLLWFPPPPEDIDNEVDGSFFAYDDDDDMIGDAGMVFSSSSSLSSIFPEKEKQHEGHREPLRTVVQGHFRALVSQLLQGEGIKLGRENSDDDWLDIVTMLAWQAANFVRPDTSRGGSMDPVDYIKVKCIASGSPSQSTFVKGVVCTKNIKHKRMTSQYKSPRLLLLGGALEYQRAANQLSSFDTLLQQEMDHLKIIVSKIEAHRPNVLLVEKSVSSYAQEYLLEKDISLVLNVKRPLLERIARCTGALITPSVDKISTSRLGHCELFRLERLSEELEKANQFNKKPSKTLMFFDGCPRRLGCTVLLKGSCRDELKKVKHVVQYAVFAAYHLSLETSFLADEGASLPKLTRIPSMAILERASIDNAVSVIPNSSSVNCNVADDDSDVNVKSAFLESDCGLQKSGEHLDAGDDLLSIPMEDKGENVCTRSSASNVSLEDINRPCMPPSQIGEQIQEKIMETEAPEKCLHPKEDTDLNGQDMADHNEVSGEYYSAADGQQSILVSFSSRCVLNGTVCERSRLLRIKFYGCFDKPLGRYLRDDLFDQASICQSCKERAEAHVLCYTHQQGNLTINVRRLPSVKLPGERDAKIWMWHRCLKCEQIDGVPPATRRVIMSDAAWGLSFGKFLELSFSNHATANRVAVCGHSLQKDCLRYYGMGSMVAFFRYSPIDILSVCLPPSILEFNNQLGQEWIRREAAELFLKTEALYSELSHVLDGIEKRSVSYEYEKSEGSELLFHIKELKDLLIKESNEFRDLLQPVNEENSPVNQQSLDILELNRLRRSLVIGSHVWDRQLFSLDSLLQTRSLCSKTTQDAIPYSEVKDWRNDNCSKDISRDPSHEENLNELSKSKELSKNGMQLDRDERQLVSEPEFHDEDRSTSSEHYKLEDSHSDGESTVSMACSQGIPSPASYLSDKIDSLWTGTDQMPFNAQLHSTFQAGPSVDSPRHMNQSDNPTLRRLTAPARVYSFDSALRIQDRIKKGLPPSSMHLSAIRSFHASGDYRSMVRDPVSSVQRTCSQISPREAQLSLNSTPSFISSITLVPEGARFLLPLSGQNNLVIAVYDNEPASIISYALSSKEYEDWIDGRPSVKEGMSNASDIHRENSAASSLSAWQSFGSMDLDYMHYGSYGTEEPLLTVNSLFTDSKKSPHLRISFEDDSLVAGGKVKFSVTSYFAKQFHALRKKCCPSEVDFIRSFSRCKRWGAQGGKSNVYFAKSLDDRFIIKQVQKTELESFEEFAPEYFKYLTDSVNSGSPTCLAKVLGIYQVTVKNMKGGRETKMELMVMENLFYKRRISRVYDLKGSARSRYNADTTGADKVLLDMNLLETLRTKPIFLGSKAKRSLERAVWNDTSFLASVDVMDYSLLVGVDEERNELVLGIIDYMRQYTWDKHLETWVKASGILGGPKNASPTIISPKQYKKRFRKAMTTYFLTVPDQWPS